MTFVLSALLVAAAISLGLRSTTGVEVRRVHPLDRLLVGLIAGAALAWVGLVLSVRWQAFEAGLGLLASLAPVGVYDAARWWSTARHPFDPWALGTRDPWWMVAIRCTAVCVVALACAGAYLAMAGVLGRR